jgi:hypothetical protein
MRKINEVLRLRFELKRSHRQIARSIGAASSTVAEYLRRFGEAGLSWPLCASLCEAELEAKLFPPAPSVPVSQRAQPDWAALHAEMRRPGVTLMLLWQEYRASHPQGFAYSWFCEHYRAWVGRLDLVMRQEHRAGEKLFVDYAGQTVPITDRDTGELRPASIFVGVLGASNYTYAEATWSQELAEWIGSHVRCFEFLGGVPEIVVPDFVAGNKIRVMCPPPLCGRLRIMPRVVFGGSRARGNIIGYRAFNQSRSSLSSFQTALLRPPAEAAQAGSHARNAAALARSVNSA